MSSIALTNPAPAPADVLSRLRERVAAIEGQSLGAQQVATDPLIAALLPEGGLRAGAMYALDASPSLLLALLAPPSQQGSWCAAVGLPHLGIEAARLAGVDISRLVLVPEPGTRWLAVVSALSEALPIVAVRPPRAGRAGAAAADAEVSRLAARLRDRGATLLVQGPWPQADAMLSLSRPTWSGIGRGEGYLSSREVTVTVSSRRHPVPRSARLQLPATGGSIAASFDVEARAAGAPTRLRAVG